MLQRLKRALRRGVKDREEGNGQQEQGHQTDAQPTQDTRTTTQNDTGPDLPCSNSPGLVLPPHSPETAPTTVPLPPSYEAASQAAPNTDESALTFRTRIALLEFQNLALRSMLESRTPGEPTVTPSMLAEARLVKTKQEYLRSRENFWEERARGIDMEETISCLKRELKQKEKTCADREAELLDLKRQRPAMLATSILDALRQGLIHPPTSQRCCAGFEDSLDAFLKEVCTTAEREKASESPRVPKA